MQRPRQGFTVPSRVEYAAERTEPSRSLSPADTSMMSTMAMKSSIQATGAGILIPAFKLQTRS
ncbi:hypothetical protein AU197_11650 [Mycobacterium sp. IS-1590]|nr:hypothetical protein AU197_11650 [Mycobacterium sp. IS-1590]